MRPQPLVRQFNTVGLRRNNWERIGTKRPFWVAVWVQGSGCHTVMLWYSTQYAVRDTRVRTLNNHGKLERPASVNVDKLRTTETRDHSNHGPKDKNAGVYREPLKIST
ncbi:hypothetical protein RRG08_065122 [Elysia crispata]|uniref:Uncharacterized protein n=1 Tax=Elysia crispata TaxID=231223 RepID=A0AAE0ZAJ3_9GAST|nr:hypothetical protein RRG08_065122 [Elysia crispata]